MSTLTWLTAFQVSKIITSPGFSMLLGGILTLFGALSTEWWRANQERKNLSQSLRVEIEECSSSLEPLRAAAEYDETGEISWDSYETDLSHWKVLDGVTLKGLLISSGVQKMDSNFDEIYSSNCEDIGRLEPAVAEAVIRFYSEYRKLKSQSEEDIEDMVNYFVRASGENGENSLEEPSDGDKWKFHEARVEINNILDKGERIHELQQECLKLLQE